MSANIKASTDGTQAIIGVGGVDQMTVSNAGVVTANSFVGNITGNITGAGTFSGNASSATATATGSTTARTLANRFADVVNVKDFGAVGDGVTDDNAAIQSAINYCNSNNLNEVLFENKTYLINSRLFWRDNVLLRGGGKTVIKISNGVDSPVIGITNQSATPAIKNIGAIGITFDGNASNSLGSIAYSAVILDPIDGAYFERCKFQNARGYGVSMQYNSDTIPNNDRVKNATFICCDFNNNGIGVGGDTYDGIDVKNCRGLKFFNCRAYSNSNDGFDFRGEDIELISCESFNNGMAGIEVSANSNYSTHLIDQTSSVRITNGCFYGNSYGLRVANNVAGGNGETLFSLTGSLIRNNSINGVEFLNSNLNTSASISNSIIKNNSENGISILGGAKQIIISNCHVLENSKNGIYCNAQSTLQVNGGAITNNLEWGYFEGSNATRNNLSGSIRIIGNSLGGVSINSSSRLTKISESVVDYVSNSLTSGDIIASASSISIPSGGRFFVITGTQTINSIGLSSRDRVVTLQFTDALTVVDNTLRLNGNFITTANDTITLVCDGSVWYEVCRSPN